MVSSKRIEYKDIKKAKVVKIVFVLNLLRHIDSQIGNDISLSEIADSYYHHLTGIGRQSPV